MQRSSRPDLSQYASLIAPILIIDSVFRGFAFFDLLWNLGTYLPSIGVFLVLVKAAIYLGGIAANVAMLKHKAWGAPLGFGVAGIAIWLILWSASSLLLAFGRGPVASAVPAMLLVRAIFRTIVRAVWSAVYLAVVWLVYRGVRPPSGPSVE